MLTTIKSTEKDRLELQLNLDAKKTQIERNKLGQFATPTALANDVLSYGLALLPEGEPIRFLDPAIGTGSFYSALMTTADGKKIEEAIGFEIDRHYGEPAMKFWANTGLKYRIADFTTLSAPVEDENKANLLICNPPYVRHHHIDGLEKPRLHALAQKAAGIKLSGLAGLYCYFMALCHEWMNDGGVAGWLIPSEFMDVNYGRSLKEYLLREVTLLHIHRFDPNDVQFDDALVSSAVVWFKKEKPLPGHSVKFSYGGSMVAPALSKCIAADDLRQSDKWTRFPKYELSVKHSGYKLNDLFSIKRGLATGDNDFFILPEEKALALELPTQFLRPILPSSRHIKHDEIHSDSSGMPLLDRRLYLLDCDIAEDEIEKEFPALWSYLQSGKNTVAQAYLCKSRKRWYSQEKRLAAPIICTYMGRGEKERPFRFLLNESKATATNVFLMLYPQPLLAKQLALDPGVIRELWQALNGISAETLLGEGRVYGGGLHKLEPKELANVPADELAAIAGLRPKREISQQLELTEALTT